MGSMGKLSSAEEISEKFKAILKSNNIHEDVSEVVLQNSGNKGDGFASQTHYVTVKFKNPTVKPLNLFVKTETPNPSHTKMLESVKAFERESLFFTEYIPLARKFCEEKGHADLLNIYPKCYYADQKMVVFENVVVDRGFELLDMKIEMQDLDAARLALTTLAKHQAIAWAMIKSFGGPTGFFTKFPIFKTDAFKTNTIRDMMEPTAEAAIKTNLELLKHISVDGKEKAVKILEEKSGVVWNTISKTLEIDSEDIALLLNHGDFWNNNMLFRRDSESGRLVDHLAIDLQVVRYDSPATDLGYYMFSSIKPEVRREHLKDLLTLYLNVLNEVTEKLSCPINLTYDALFQSFRRKFEFGFWFSGITLATNAARLAMKEFDVDKTDMNDFGTFISNYALKWINNNPDACKQDAIMIVGMMLEYDSLRMK